MNRVDQPRTTMARTGRLIMFWLAVVEMVAVYVNSISLGILFIQGAVCCTYPLYNFVTGCTAVGTWCCASIRGLVLVLNRMRALLGKDGWIERNTWSSLLFTSCYGAYYTLLTPPGCLNFKYQTLMFSPYYSIPHAFNNIVIVSLTTLLYAVFLVLFIHKSQYGSPAYDCSAVHESGQWWSVNHGQPQLALGTWSVLFGTISLVSCMFKSSRLKLLHVILYVPCTLAILPLRKQACFKTLENRSLQIMIWLAAVDIVALSVNSFSLGILLLQGAVYCTYPLYNYVTGCIALGSWCGASIGGLVLVINRMRALLRRVGWMESNISSVLIFTTFYWAYYTLFTPPGFANSKYQTFLFTPVIYASDEFNYHSIPHAFNNIVVVSLSTLLYADFLIMLIQKSILIQASLICLFDVVASATFAYMNFIGASFSLMQFGQICWQLSHGMPPFIYLFLNRTIS
ncbi:hypothetical protein PRIPAC_80635 [Pristionchus pacificus]|uniref:G protein-coupled receptor n=1 Tax=Pristionchus pacificus TaxID=54126 RepID=A0A2A6CJI9_PRIPA|nr:hypothetical protein PRIPAC_80635 [Pristionchus pacificus]|eukprot:PDM78247.1 G protein-coupled receptor [Pristionchus pacificus]